MARCYTNCVERRLCLCFEMLGAFIGSHPWWFLIAPLVLSAGFGSGFYFLTDRLSNDIEKHFTPANGRAKAERKYIQETFPANESMFSSLRLSTDGIYATFIASSDGNVLTEESLQEMLHLDFKIRAMAVHLDTHTYTYANVCAQVMGSCISNDILDIIKYKAKNIAYVNLTFPWYHWDLKNYPLHLSLGSVSVNAGSSVVKSAGAIQLRYYLKQDSKRETDLWLENFIKLLSNESSRSFQVTYSTSMSMQWEFDKSPASVIHLFSITYAITIIFSILSCWRLDCVRTKVWVASCGVLSTGLAVLSSFGLLFLLGQPFVATAASCPFMILGIGLDDMFIMISCWQRTRVQDGVPERLAETFRSSATSISITTLTDALALFLGLGSPFSSVRSFCLYAGVSVCFCFLYSVTFLGACMALNGQREAGNKHWFTCAEIPEDNPPAGSHPLRLCCIGGSFDQITGREESEPVGRFFEQFYGPFLTHKFIKPCVCVIYAAYLSVSIYGCFSLKEGLDIRNLALDESYLQKYYSGKRQHFSEYGYSVMAAVRTPFPYWDQKELQHLHSCISDFEHLNYVNSSFGWFASFQQYLKKRNASAASQETFQTHLSSFLQGNPEFRQDVNLTEDNRIQASRFFIQTLHKTPMKDMLIGLRRTANECPIDLLVYHPTFIYFDQYTVVKGDTIQTVLVAAAVMLVVSLVLIPGPLCSAWVAFAVCSVITGVTGFMSLWDVNLDSISMINLVMCIGFSVDFSAHVTYSFVASSRRDANESAREALAHLGYPIVQGALSTLSGVAVLSMSGSYLFRTFFKIVSMVIIFGLLHGLMFLPVFLALFGRFWREN